VLTGKQHVIVPFNVALMQRISSDLAGRGLVERYSEETVGVLGTKILSRKTVENPRRAQLS
jgi:hypothetical protein